ncbi:MAG: bifunctional phosphoserine phosphatase/homoserine phosphotransferase ThrH [Microthrixaceae bacterium]
MSDSPRRQTLVTLDLEGVLIPEVWIATAEATGIDDLRRTTRDEPDYDVLMKWRLDVLGRNDLKMADVEKVIATLTPLDGARAFLDELRSLTQLIILSDTFEEFARPFMAQLGLPTVFCHSLLVDDSGAIADYRLRQTDQKRNAVKAFHGLNYQVIAAGDSYNDTTMLSEADHGFLFRAPTNVIDEFPDYPALESYDDLLARITGLL